MMNRARSIVAEGVEYIENHLKERIALEDVAQSVGVSRYHLERIFRSLTGESLMGYATARKLSSSVGELLHTKMKIIDIAFEYGFEYEQSYIRAFRRMFGFTPLKTRHEKKAVRVREKLDINDFLSVDNAIAYRPFFVVMPGFHLVGIPYTIPEGYEDFTPNRVGRDFFFNHQHRISNVRNRNIYYAYVEWNSTQRSSVYMPSALVDRVEKPLDGMIVKAIPAQKYAVFRFVGFFRPEDINIKHFGHLVEFMNFQWVIQSGYEQAAPYHLEVIDNALAKDDYCEVDLYRPIKEKNNP